MILGKKKLSDKQRDIYMWGCRTFGPAHMSDPKIRCLRLLEEVIELCQSVGLRLGDVQPLPVAVYAKPAGAQLQELGGVMVTVLATASSIGYLAETALDLEMNRIYSRPREHFIAREQAKMDAGWLPATEE
jgi:NTP pyrophosphatase (non-canonical NTP hydrolase)